MGKHALKIIYVNFEDAPQLQTLFIADFDIARIINVLEVYTCEHFIPGKLDEVQAAEKAITSLKDDKEESWMTNIPLYSVEYALVDLWTKKPDTKCIGFTYLFKRIF